MIFKPHTFAAPWLFVVWCMTLGKACKNWRREPEEESWPAHRMEILPFGIRYTDKPIAPPNILVRNGKYGPVTHNPGTR